MFGCSVPALCQQSVTVLFNYDFTGHTACTSAVTTNCFDRFEAGTLSGSALSSLTSIPAVLSTGSVTGISGTFPVGLPGPTEIAVIAVARDGSGNRLTSDPLQCKTEVVIGDTTPPSVSFLAPSNGSTVSGVISVQTAATDNLAVSGTNLFLDGLQIATTGTVSLDTSTISNGSHVLTAKANDAAGNTGSVSISLTVSNVAPDTIPPIVTFVSPTDGAAVSGTIPVQVSATDNVAVQNVALFMDGVQIATGLTVQWNTTSVFNGLHTLTARATDTAGNMGSSAVTVVVNNADTVPPAIQIIWPTAGMTIPRGEVLLTCAATDNIGVAGVQWQVDGVNAGPELLLAPYSMRWNSALISGKGWHVVTAIARDAGGLKTVSESVRFRIQ